MMGKINPSNPTLLKQIKGLNFFFFFIYTASLFTLMILSFVIYSSTVIPNKKPDSVLLVDIQKTCVSTEILADKHTHISTSREWLLSSSCACLSFPRGHGGEGWGVGGGPHPVISCVDSWALKALVLICLFFFLLFFCIDTWAAAVKTPVNEISGERSCRLKGQFRISSRVEVEAYSVSRT